MSVTAGFFALFGFVFLITQYFHLIRGYGPLEAGVRTLPVAISIALASVLSPRLVERIGTKVVVAGGLAPMAAAGLVAQRLGNAAPAYLAEVSDAFLAGLAAACLAVAAVAAASSLFAIRHLPALTTSTDDRTRHCRTQVVTRPGCGSAPPRTSPP